MYRKACSAALLLLLCGCGNAAGAANASSPVERAKAALPRIAIVPGITLCNVEKRAWYAWLRDQLAGPPLHMSVELR
jgi:hypothetical protein